MKTRTAYLIDGTAFCYRAYYAIKELTTQDGRATNAVYGFITMLNAIREKENPDYLAVAFDLAGDTFRHEKYEDYKIQRDPMPDPLIDQIPMVKDVLAAYRIPIFECEGFEGEDVLATITQKIRKDKLLKIFLVTADKDVLQLIDDQVHVYNPYQKNGPPDIDAKAVKEKYGLEPRQIIDLLALMGDSVDNIPGVPGVGPKRAQQLLERFGSLEEIYKQVDQIESASQKQKLVDHKEDAFLSQELATIQPTAPIKVTLKDIAVVSPDVEALRHLFREFEFRRLLRELPQDDQPEAAPVKVAALNDLKALESFLKTLGKQPTALGVFPLASTDQMVCVFGQEALGACVVGDSFWLTPCGKHLKTWLENDAVKKIGHDLKTVYRRLNTQGIVLSGIEGDTSIAAYLLDSSRSSPKLEDLCEKYCERSLKQPELLELSAADPQQQQTLYESLAPSVAVVLDLHQRLLEGLEQESLRALYLEMEVPLIGLLAEMEATGIALDVPCLDAIKVQVKQQLLGLDQEIEKLAGQSFNPKSPKQLAKVLFEDLGLPVIKRTKTGASTDSEVLNRLSEQHPLPSKVIEYRELSKLLSTYIEALPKLVNPKTLRLHTHLNQTGTATGRLSSNEPNLQNIPIKTVLGRSIRKAFVPGIKKGVLVSADYSQVELRILAHFSGDPSLIQAFKQGADIHRYTASLIYGIPEDEVQPEQRSAMKAVNFGVLYGMTSHGLSNQLDITYQEAQSFIDAYFERYAKVRAYLDSQIKQAKTKGYVETLWGRKRYIPEVKSPQMMQRQFGERMAINAPIQGTAADLIKRAMLLLQARLKSEGFEAQMLLQVHDDLLFAMPEKEASTLIPIISEVMEGVADLKVPLEVSLKMGPNWLEMAPIAQ